MSFSSNLNLSPWSTLFRSNPLPILQPLLITRGWISFVITLLTHNNVHFVKTSSNFQFTIDFLMKCGNHNCGNHFIVSSFGNSFAWKEVCVAYCNRLLYNICQIESIKFVPSTINLDRCWISMQLQSKPLIPPTVLNVVGHVQYREYHDNDNEKKLTIFNHLLFSYFCDSFFDLQILTNWTFMFPFQISMSCNHIKPLAHSSK